MSGLASQAYSFDNGQTWQKENTKIYTENTNGVIIKVRDILGNIATYQTINVNKIDKQAPTISSVTGNATQWTKGNVTLTVNATDNMSGLANEAYSFDNGQTWQKENTKTYTGNTNGVIIKVRDAVGNIATYQTINIDKIYKLKEITIKEMPKKTKYYTKDNLDTEGLVLKATYDNGTEEEIKTGYDYTPKTLNTEGKQTITITYEGKTTKYEVEVEKLNINIKTYKTKTKENETYITEIKQNTTVEELKKQIETNGTIKIYKGEEEITDEKAIIGTGMTIQIETEKYTLVVTGDVNGDGKISLIDLANLKLTIIGKKELNTVSTLAGDVNGDDKMGLSDLAKIKFYLVGKTNI